MHLKLALPFAYPRIAFNFWSSYLYTRWVLE